MSALPTINPDRLRETAHHLRENSLRLAKYPGMTDEARARELAACYIEEIAWLYEVEQAAAGEPPMTKPNLGCAFNCEWPTKCCCIEGAMP